MPTNPTTETARTTLATRDDAHLLDLLVDVLIHYRGRTHAPAGHPGYHEVRSWVDDDVMHLADDLLRWAKEQGYGKGLRW